MFLDSHLVCHKASQFTSQLIPRRTSSLGATLRGLWPHTSTLLRLRHLHHLSDPVRSRTKSDYSHALPFSRRYIWCCANCYRWWNLCRFLGCQRTRNGDCWICWSDVSWTNRWTDRGFIYRSVESWMEMDRLGHDDCVDQYRLGCVVHCP